MDGARAQGVAASGSPSRGRVLAASPSHKRSGRSRCDSAACRSSGDPRTRCWGRCLAADRGCGQGAIGGWTTVAKSEQAMPQAEPPVDSLRSSPEDIAASSGAPLGGMGDDADDAPALPPIGGIGDEEPEPAPPVPELGISTEAGEVSQQVPGTNFDSSRPRSICADRHALRRLPAVHRG
jgi:hypothetical protein